MKNTNKNYSTAADRMLEKMLMLGRMIDLSLAKCSDDQKTGMVSK